MLSILIPTYNYNALPLVKELKQQCDAIEIIYDITVYDDCSPNPIAENNKINSLKNCNYTFLDQNIGRSAIRNSLAHNATYDTLLFLDVDTFPKNKDFIKKYIQAFTPQTEIIYGGIEYQKETPDTSIILRWIYGKKREALSVIERKKNCYLRFLTLSFIIKKSVFNKIKFNETIPNLRHEDTLFALEAKKHKIHLLHINNPVIHLGLETSNQFLKKSLESVDVLKYFIDNNLLKSKDTSLSEIASKVKRLGLSTLFNFFYKISEPLIKRNLLSKKPSLILFDLYRLGYFLNLK